MNLRWPTQGAAEPRTDAMFAPTTESLLAIHKKQVHRDRWPDFGAFEPNAYPSALRRDAAVQWAGRARAEHNSIHQFSALSRALCEVRAPLTLLGPIARLITDEVRHAEICAAYALACYPEGLEEDKLVAWKVPRAPWPDAPGLLQGADDASDLVVWAADAIMTACCFGETLSVPMLKAISLVSTDPVASQVADQILRDEHLHARFGWEALGVLLEHLDEAGRASLQARLPSHMAGFEASTCIGIRLEDLLADPEISIEEDDDPNLGTLSKRQYAFIFYDTMENEIFPQLGELGFDAMGAWAGRGGVG